MKMVAPLINNKNYRNIIKTIKKIDIFFHKKFPTPKNKTTTMTTKTIIELNEVPESIKTCSSLYKTLITEFEEDTNNSMVEFEEKHVTFPKTVQTYEDIKTWLEHYRFWMMSEFPNEVYEFVLSDVDKSQWLKKEDPELFMGFEDLLWIIEKNIRKKTMSEEHKVTCFQKGFLNIIKNIDLDKNNRDYCMYAAANNNLECLRYAHEQECYWDERTCYNASYHGHSDCLKYAHENGCPWGKQTVRCAMLNGKLDCLKYAHKNGCPLEYCYIAALKGHLECLRYAHENGCPWDRYTCSDAALNGHLECLQYAHENGCPWDIHTCSSAARNGHLECLRYAHENGCPWDIHTCSDAALNGHLECLQYAKENGCPES
jgi:hypothetical protein